MREKTQLTALVAIVLTGWGCDLLGPSCLSRQHRGFGPAITGQIAAGEIRSIQVHYETEGSQNDLKVSWGDQYTTGGPRIRVYATKLECLDFRPPQDMASPQVQTSPSCAWIGGPSGIEPSGRFIQTALTVTNG